MLRNATMTQDIAATGGRCMCTSLDFFLDALCAHFMIFDVLLQGDGDVIFLFDLRGLSRLYVRSTLAASARLISVWVRVPLEPNFYF